MKNVDNLGIGQILDLIDLLIGMRADFRKKPDEKHENVYGFCSWLIGKKYNLHEELIEFLYNEFVLIHGEARLYWFGSPQWNMWERNPEKRYNRAKFLTKVINKLRRKIK